VLVPPVEYSEVDHVDDVASLTDAISHIAAADVDRPGKHVQYQDDDSFVDGPVAVESARPTPERASVLVYRDQWE
jgi:hypothetical protein